LHGKSAVVNNYGIPLGVMSGNWTYYDHNFGGESDVRLTPAGYVPVDDPRQFLWLADKQQNPDYLRPETFVCVRMPNFDTVAKRLNGGRELELADCGALPLIRRIERKTQRIVEHKLVARDKNTPSTWAIVTLDWDFPPYLLNLDDGRSDEVVRLVVNQQPDTLTVQVQYRYAHQDGLPEKGSTVRLNAAGADGRWCVFERSSSRNSFTLPADFRGTLRPSVMPRTETKAGPETFGKPVVIGDGQGTPCTGK
jgi:hypothetical protein